MVDHTLHLANTFTKTYKTMADSFTQIIIQVVFAVHNRRPAIHEANRVSIEKYICGIISGMKSKPLAIYCNPDHCHILLGLNPNVTVSETVQIIKVQSSKWINEHGLVSGVFKWQAGYGAFSYSRSQMKGIVRYILNQPEHHKNKSFEDEYIEFLRLNEIEIGRKQVFDGGA